MDYKHKILEILEYIAYVLFASLVLMGALNSSIVEIMKLEEISYPQAINISVSLFIGTLVCKLAMR